MLGLSGASAHEMTPAYPEVNISRHGVVKVEMSFLILEKK